MVIKGIIMVYPLYYRGSLCLGLGVSVMRSSSVNILTKLPIIIILDLYLFIAAADVGLTIGMLFHSHMGCTLSHVMNMGEG